MARFNIVLLEPEIPQNTGNIGRTCMALGTALHLIQPLGFSLEDKYLKRAGMDYWQHLDVTVHPDWNVFRRMHYDGAFFFLSKKVDRFYHEADYCQEKIYMVFGKETLGLPDSMLDQYKLNSYRIPMQPHARSINLSSAVAVVLYEAHRQNGFPLQPPE